MNKRKLKLDDFGISQDRYSELLYFCRQYSEWKDFLKYNNDTVKSLEITDMPICHNNSDQTCNLAVKRVEYQKNIQIIEECADKSSQEFAKYLIMNICDGERIDYLIDIKRMPLCRTVFYEYRRNFFQILDKMK
jgi:hypothetical protein